MIGYNGTRKANIQFFFTKYVLISHSTGNEDNIFQVKPRKSSGHFGIFTTKPLDREQNSFHQLVIEAFNTAERAPNSTTAVNVTAIDQNDNAPRFEQKTYNANISENVTVGTKVFTLNAVDTDEGSNAVVTYHLLAGSGVGTFTVNRTTGMQNTPNTSRCTIVKKLKYLRHYWNIINRINDCNFVTSKYPI